MPRVFRKTKNKGGHKEYKCSAPTCVSENRAGGSRTIQAGEDYLTWKFNRGGRYFRHAACGFPRRSELSHSKMGPVWDAVDDFDPVKCESVEDLQSELQSIAEVAREVGAEYGDSADNIESAWPNGNPTSEACRATSEELESWADDLDSWDFDEYDAGSDEHESEEDWLEAARQDAREKVDEQPEYQG